MIATIRDEYKAKEFRNGSDYTYTTILKRSHYFTRIRQL